VRRLLVVLLLAVALVPVAGGTAWACTCDGYGDGSERAQYRGLARDARLIYTGQVTVRRDPPQAPSTAPAPAADSRYSIRVEERLKRSVPDSREISSTGSSCGVALEEGRRALVVELRGDGRVGVCDGTTQHDVDARAAIVRDELASLPRTGAPPPGIHAFAFVLVGLALAGWTARRFGT